MKPLKTLVAIEGEKSLRVFDTIFFEDRLWLVPFWHDSQKAGGSMPERIIALESLDHEKGSVPGIDYQLKHSIPRAVLEGRSRESKGTVYEVLERPDVFFPFEKK